MKNWAILGAVAVVVLAAGVGIGLRRGWFPAGDAGLAFPAGAVEPADRTELTAAPTRFAWPPVPEADWYWVILYDHDGNVMWESVGVQDPEVATPVNIADRIAWGRDYFWEVSVDVGPDRVDSNRFRFRLIPPPPAESLPRRNPSSG